MVVFLEDGTANKT